jgi:hypothetical protein
MRDHRFPTTCEWFTVASVTLFWKVMVVPSRHDCAEYSNAIKPKHGYHACNLLKYGAYSLTVHLLPITPGTPCSAWGASPRPSRRSQR